MSLSINLINLGQDLKVAQTKTPAIIAGVLLY